VALATDGQCKPVEVRLLADTAPLARGHAERGERCELAGIGPVPVTIARSLLTDASVVAMVQDGDDITAVSSPKRTIPAKLRRALEARYPTCGVIGCANDWFLQIDHVVPVEDQGETNVHNTWRICPHHHFLKTFKGWRVVGEPGNWDLVPPDASYTADTPDPP
jgi:5-methylcytosine-specific restriction endonuclease McrA